MFCNRQDGDVDDDGRCHCRDADGILLLIEYERLTKLADSSNHEQIAITSVSS
jgi:hypothetical protein